MQMEIQQTDQFRKWLHRLRDHAAKARITARIRQCGLAGQPVGDMHPVGKGVNELRFFRPRLPRLLRPERQSNHVAARRRGQNRTG